MKTYKLILSGLFCLMLSAVAAQSKNDSMEMSEKSDSKTEEANTVSVRSKASMGYHHGNYKHPMKAKKARRFYTVKGHVNESASATNYKNPHTNKVDSVSEKAVILEAKSSKKARNYKQPYNN